jgi:ADP-ribose 1''-phosphate phosphatase
LGDLVTVKGSLFTAPKNTIIIHACNTKGVWGSGIAKEFAKRFPKAYEQYRLECQQHGAHLLGTASLIPTKDYVIGCLFTSKAYGAHVDSPEKILIATRLAIADLILKNGKYYNLPMHICKINSGLFRVPWQDTKKILKETGQPFTVYDY